MLPVDFYGLAVLLMYALASTALGLALAPFGVWFLKAMGMKIDREEMEKIKAEIRGMAETLG